MSYWVTAKVLIKDLEVFWSVCNRFGVEISQHQYIKEEFSLKNTKVNGSNNYAILRSEQSEDEGIYWVLKSDNDINYNCFNTGLGDNSSVLLQAYTHDITVNNVTNYGGTIISEELQNDGSLMLRVAM